MGTLTTGTIADPQVPEIINTGVQDPKPIDVVSQAVGAASEIAQVAGKSYLQHGVSGELDKLNVPFGLENLMKMGNKEIESLALKQSQKGGSLSSILTQAEAIIRKYENMAPGWAEGIRRTAVDKLGFDPGAKLLQEAFSAQSSAAAQQAHDANKAFDHGFGRGPGAVPAYESWAAGQRMNASKLQQLQVESSQRTYNKDEALSKFTQGTYLVNNLVSDGIITRLQSIHNSLPRANDPAGIENFYTTIAPELLREIDMAEFNYDAGIQSLAGGYHITDTATMNILTNKMSDKFDYLRSLVTDKTRYGEFTQLTDLRSRDLQERIFDMNAILRAAHSIDPQLPSKAFANYFQTIEGKAKGIDIQSEFTKAIELAAVVNNERAMPDPVGALLSSINQLHTPGTTIEEATPNGVTPKQLMDSAAPALSKMYLGSADKIKKADPEIRDSIISPFVETMGHRDASSPATQNQVLKWLIDPGMSELFLDNIDNKLEGQARADFITQVNDISSEFVTATFQEMRNAIGSQQLHNKVILDMEKSTGRLTARVNPTWQKEALADPLRAIEVYRMPIALREFNKKLDFGWNRFAIADKNFYHKDQKDADRVVKLIEQLAQPDLAWLNRMINVPKPLKDSMFTNTNSLVVPEHQLGDFENGRVYESESGELRRFNGTNGTMDLVE